MAEISGVPKIFERRGYTIIIKYAQWKTFLVVKKGFYFESVSDFSY